MGTQTGRSAKIGGHGALKNVKGPGIAGRYCRRTLRARGFRQLIAILNVADHKVLTWQLSYWPCECRAPGEVRFAVRADELAAAS